MSKRHLAMVVSASTMLMGSAAWSQAAGPADGARSDLEAVIVTGRRPPLNAIPMGASFTQSSITAEAILNITPSPATTVQTLLTSQPSIYATTGGTNGMETDIKFRAFSDGEFGETLAGVPLNDIFNSGVTYQADNRNNGLLITRDLDSVEIYRGVNNPAVNTYNSLGGTINYLPRQPAETPGGDIGIDGGAFDTFNYHVTLNTGDWHGVKQTISYEHDFSAGWLRYTPDWNDNIYYAARADLSKNTQVFLYGVYNKNKGDAPQFIPQNILDQQFNFQWSPAQYRSLNSDENFLIVGGFKTAIGDWITIEDEVYGGDNNYTRTSFSDANYGGPYFIDDQGSGYPFWSGYMGYAPGDPGFDQFPSSTAATDYHFYGYDASLIGDRAQISLALPDNKVTFGGDFNSGHLHSREYWYGAMHMPQIVGYNDAWDEHDTRTMWSLYVQDDIHLLGDRLHLIPGVKYIEADTTDVDALGFYYSAPGGVSAREHFTSPTFGASFAIAPSVSVYGAIGQNVKFPDITAFYNAIAGADTAPVVVKPEYAQDYEIGARYKHGGLQAEVNFYAEHFTHIIESASTPTGFTQYQNGGSEDFRGVEAQFTGEFGKVLTGNLKAFLNASYNEAVCATVSRDDLSGTSCNPGQSLPNVPRWLGTLGLIWDRSGWHVDLQARYVGSQQLADANSNLPGVIGDIQPGQNTQNPRYVLLNLGVTKVVPVRAGPVKALRFALHVDNILNEKYYSSAQTNTDANNPINPATGNPLLDFYGLAGEPRAAFGSISVYF